MSRPQTGTPTSGDLVIGGYTPDTDGSGPGLTVVRADPSGGLAPVAEAPASGPSFVVEHPELPLLYAVLERPDGGVAVFAEEPGGPRRLAERPSGGSFPCHVAIDPDAEWLAVANYGDGTVAAYRLDDDGMLAPDPLLFRNEGSGPDPERQRGPHAHQAVFGPDRVLHVTDLGTDEMRRFLPGMVPHPEGPVRLAPGSGPRHFVHHQEHWYVTGELDGTVRVYDEDWREVGGTAASESGEHNLPSHIAVSADGRHLYVGNRGPDTVTVFAPDGPRLERVAEVPSGGHWPRHFAVTPDRLYVAEQRSDEVTALDLVDGLPRAGVRAMGVGSPSCVLVRSRATATGDEGPV
ncbi:lactonase family protein [Microbispora sp. RL4-1S]|uniref:Lactonase family protein n=1 Tax=Microbispora oryzae TaxID=2806554 RepID=A0A940WN17_9ACTN|nr:beta-propeller fold lactonase family protein [Microbispora oryzae]MBP2704046.1 lactonase family protein [Microbispora oryzae]